MAIADFSRLFECYRRFIVARHEYYEKDTGMVPLLARRRCALAARGFPVFADFLEE
jgi:hypothetical protein